MSYFKSCPDCGANLDPGERCECKGPVRIAINQASPDVKVVAYTRWEEGDAYKLKLADGRVVTAYFEDYKAALAEKQRKNPLKVLKIIELDLDELAKYVLTKVAS